MTLRLVTLGIMTLRLMTLGIMTLGIMTLGIMTLGIMTLGITIECHYAECSIFSLLCLVSFRLIMNIFITFLIVILSVMKPFKYMARLDFHIQFIHDFINLKLSVKLGSSRRGGVLVHCTGTF